VHQKILDHLSETIMLFDNDLKLTYINSAGEILFADSAATSSVTPSNSFLTILI